jgi:cholesterol oxidase
MANDPLDGVTDPNGKVWGTRALYVLDGAAIPSSLGTNPSATIAAIAERNVRKALADRESPIFTSTEVPLDRVVPGWPPELTVAEIQRRLGQTPEVLDPIRNTPTSASPDPASPAVGLTFEEVMQGFYARGPGVNLPIRSELLATIDDLNAFLVNPRRAVAITGKVFLTPARGVTADSYDAKGTLSLLRRIDTVTAVEKVFSDWLRRHGSSPAVAAQPPDIGVAMDALLRKLVKQAHRYEMEYDLELTGPGGPLKFKGLKRIYGGRGLDVWTETTTLEVTLTDAAGAEVGKGKMRVHLADFLRRQLPSFTVTGTRVDDDVRIAWAFGRFFRFFFGTLRQVYLPQLETLNPFGDRTS